MSASTLPSQGLRTEFPFVLPRGYPDSRGEVHREGVMRLATARDEIQTQTDPRVRQNPAYLTVLLLERTITKLGKLEADDIDADVVENLFASDLAFLQDLYRRINQDGHTEAAVACPSCGHEFAVDVAGDASGGIVTYAADRLWEEVAYVAYYLHWPLDSILDLEHPYRNRVIEEVGRIHERMEPETYYETPDEYYE